MYLKKYGIWPYVFKLYAVCPRRLFNVGFLNEINSCIWHTHSGISGIHILATLPNKRSREANKNACFDSATALAGMVFIYEKQRN